MKKRNVFIQTAIASALLAMSVSALAGSLSVTKRTVANEAFGSAFTAATPVYVPNIAYVFNTPAGIVVNDGGSISIVFTMTGGQWSSSAALAITNAVSSSMGGVFGVAAPVVTTVATANDTLTVVLNNASGGNITIGIGGTLTLTSVGGAARYQATGVIPGTPVAVSAKVMNGVNVLETAASATVVDTAAAIASTFTASTETKKINLSATPAGSALTAGVAGANKVQLGKVVFSNVTGAQNDLDVVAATLAETPITVGAPAFGTDYTVTVGKASGMFTAKQSIGLYLDAACATPITSGATTLAPLATAVTAATTSIVATTVSANAVDAATDLGSLFVCSDYSGVTAGAVINEFTPTIAASYTKASTAYTGATLAANNGYALTNNGATVYVRNYIPSGVAGYLQTVRLINTGTTAATASVSLIDDATGVESAAVPVGVSMAPGVAQRLSQAAIEAAVGPIAATARPRLKFTAPTSGMEAQSFFNNANGAYTNLSGIE